MSVEQTGGLPYLNVVVRRDRIARHGINARDVLDAVAVIGGREAGEVFEGQRRFPVQVRLPAGVRDDLARLRQVKVADPRGRLVPLDQLADFPARGRPDADQPRGGAAARGHPVQRPGPRPWPGSWPRPSGRSSRR